MAKGSLTTPFKIFGIGKKKRQYERDLAAAQGQLDTRMQSYEDFEFETFKPSNPYEDMTVNTQAAEFQRDMQAQAQADTLQALRGAGGSAGAASLATAMSRQAAEKERAISADIGKQEQQIQMKVAQQDAANQAMMIQQEQARQQFQLDRMGTMMGMDMAKVTGIEQKEQARKDRNMQLASTIVGGATDILGAGLAPDGFLNP
tara:strand:+ start:506 stop:1114 length:609 start_codon:yes stop_codon:yes gene_type:complete